MINEKDSSVGYERSELIPDTNIKAITRKRKIEKFIKASPFIIMIASYIAVILGMVLSVFVNAFSTGWFGTFLPEEFTTEWFVQAWRQYDIWSYYKLTIFVTLISTVVSLTLSLPGAYILSRRNFPFKQTLINFYQLPFMLPEIAYAIPLASVFYTVGLAETSLGLILAQMLIGIPFSMFILMPFIEALDPRLEVAAQTLGANKFKLFQKIIIPQLIPGITSAAINIFIRMFSTFLVILLISGIATQTLPVMVFSVLDSAGNQANSMVDALTLSLMLPLLAFTFLSLWVSSYTQKRTGNK